MLAEQVTSSPPPGPGPPGKNSLYVPAHQDNTGFFSFISNVISDLAFQELRKVNKVDNVKQMVLILDGSSEHVSQA